MTLKELRKQARSMHSCALFGGYESERELAELMFSPQGVEFCTENSFPPVEAFGDLMPNAADYGIYVNAGDMELNDARRVYLIGDTHARLGYSDPGKRHEVIALHGATASICADGYSVVFLYNDDKSFFDVKTYNHAYVR